MKYEADEDEEEGEEEVGEGITCSCRSFPMQVRFVEQTTSNVKQQPRASGVRGGHAIKSGSRPSIAL